MKIPTLAVTLTALLAVVPAHGEAPSRQAVASQEGITAPAARRADWAVADAVARQLNATDDPRAPADTHGRTRHRVKKGETLQGILKKYLPIDTPLRPEFLQRIVLQLNPGGFRKNNPRQMIAGTTLEIPSPHELYEAILAASSPASAEYQPDPMKQWVRYP